MHYLVLFGFQLYLRHLILGLEYFYFLKNVIRKLDELF